MVKHMLVLGAGAIAVAFLAWWAWGYSPRATAPDTIAEFALAPESVDLPPLPGTGADVPAAPAARVVFARQPTGRMAVAGAHPVVFYTPGWTGLVADNEQLVRELASRGFIVVVVTYPARSRGISDADWQAQRDALSAAVEDYSSEQAFRKTMALADDRVRRRAGDVRRLIDVLGPLNTGAIPSPLAGLIDARRIAAIGYSIGGAVAAEAAVADPRIVAAVNVDGRHWGEALARGVPKPYLYVGENLHMPTEADLRAADPVRRFNAQLDQVDYANLARHLELNGGVQVTIHGSEHADFSDFSQRLTVNRIRHLKLARPSTVRGLMIRYIAAFLEATLDAHPSPPPWISTAPVMGVTIANHAVARHGE